MNTNKKTPKLRFKGFTDDWEQRKLGDLGTLKNGMNFSKEAMGKGYPFINLQNIFGSNVIDLTKLEKAEATDSQLKDYNLQKGDVLFVRSSVKLEGVGEAALISEDLKDTTFSGFIIRFRDNYGLDYNFKRFIFTTVLIRNQIMSQATNSANKNISQSVLNDLNLFIPTKDEQSKIGLIFSELDKCITLHQRKLEKLKLNKSALLQRIFPQNGCTVPDVRFKGFTEDWEQRKFSDLYEKISEKNDLSYTLDKIISVANMYYKSDAKVSNEEYLKTYNIFRYGEIAFEGNKSKAFTYGRFVENTIGDGIVSHVFEVFRPVNKYDIYFWKYYINYEPIMGKILSRCTKKTTMMTNLVVKDFLNETILVPDLTEQKQIGALLNTLDKYITLHQYKLNSLMSIKKALLQQLFV